MATPKKVIEYMVATQMEEGFRQVAQGFLQQMSLNSLCEGDMEGALYAQFQSKLQDRLQAQILGMIRRLVSELFTDGELDALIAIYNMPVSRKARELIPVIQLEILNFSNTVDFGRLSKEIMAEMRDES